MAAEKLTSINRAGKKTIVYFGIVVLAVIICILFVWHFSQMPEIKNPPISKPPAEIKEKTLTPEEIQEALNKKAAGSQKEKALTQEEIQKALNKKIPKNQKPKSLTPEEIQKALNKKVK